MNGSSYRSSGSRATSAAREILKRRDNKPYRTEKTTILARKRKKELQVCQPGLLSSAHVSNHTNCLSPFRLLLPIRRPAISSLLMALQTSLTAAKSYLKRRTSRSILSMYSENTLAIRHPGLDLLTTCVGQPFQALCQGAGKAVPSRPQDWVSLQGRHHRRCVRRATIHLPRRSLCQRKCSRKATPRWSIGRDFGQSRYRTR
jgi:hypothetical protein